MDREPSALEVERDRDVGVFGHERLQTLPIWELPFDQLPEGTPRRCVTVQDHGLEKALDHQLVELAEDGTAKIEGDLTIKGITQPVVAAGTYTARVTVTDAGGCSSSG